MLLAGHRTVIKAASPKSELQKLKKYLNTGLFLTNFTMDKALRAEYTAEVEVVIAAFDWEQATTRQEGMTGMMQSVVWYSVGRTIIPIPTTTLQDVGAELLVQQAYKAILGSAFEAFLLAY